MNLSNSPPNTSDNSGYAVRAEYRPLPNCPTFLIAIRYRILYNERNIIGRKYKTNLLEETL